MSSGTAGARGKLANRYPIKYALFLLQNRKALMSDCVFCKIGSREIPAMIVYESDEFVAFRDIAPKAPVHVILMPRKHYNVLHECSAVDDALLGRMLLAAAEVVKQEQLTESGYRIVLNGGESQAVPHLHLHLLGGRSFSWPPG